MTRDQAIDALRAKVEALAYASPPPPERDAQMARLKASIATLLADERGETRFRTHLVPALQVGLSIAALLPIALGIGALSAAGRGQQVPWKANPHYFDLFPFALAVLALVIIALPLWYWLKAQRRLRAAFALAATLPGPRPEPRSAPRQAGGGDVQDRGGSA